jgi:NAD(P)-dependent dehydrogenase (short-subunit alcohol dehydrogenase family)
MGDKRLEFSWEDIMATHLIVGADRGIAEALCLQLCARGENVIAACLEGSPTLTEKGARVETGVDVTSDAAVHAFAQRMTGTHVDMLINVAGIYLDDSLERLDLAGVQRQLEVNAIGPLRVVHALLACLGQGSKVGIVTSRMGSVTDNTSGRLYGYRMSKAAANMAGVSLAQDLKAQGIAVALLHPGMVNTSLVPNLPDSVRSQLIEPEAAARGLLARMDALTLEQTGKFWHANGEVLPW